jgi:hypothetical protein
MIPNTDPKTGIKYGVVSMNALEDWVFDEFFYNGRNLTYEAAVEEFEAEFEDEHGRPPDDEDHQEWADYYEPQEEQYDLEVPDEGLQLHLSYLGGAPLVWVIKSPFVTRTRECSPCVPQGGDLEAKDEQGFDTYDLPLDWYRPEDRVELKARRKVGGKRPVRRNPIRGKRSACG